MLLTDREAEHIPGCNMAFRKEWLQRIGGFDPQFWTAGDDVDVCWRLNQAGGTLGFHGGAVVWHHRRRTARSYMRQQHGYGRAEALLERKWPEKYNGGGHVSWSGRVYGGGSSGHGGGHRWRIYYGTGGSAAYQSIYERSPTTLAALPLMAEWYLLLVVLAGLSVYEIAAEPLSFELPAIGIPFSVVLFAIAFGVLPIHALCSAWSCFSSSDCRRLPLLWRRTLTGLLHLVQPMARLGGRLQHGLTPWRRRGALGFGLPWARQGTVWSETWLSLPDRMLLLEPELRPHSAGLRRGGSYDRWDVQVRTGVFGCVRARLAVEEHGAGKQLVRYRIWPRLSSAGVIAVGALAALVGLAASRHELGPLLLVSALATIVGLRTLRDFGCAANLFLRSVGKQGEETQALREAGGEGRLQPAFKPAQEVEP